MGIFFFNGDENFQKVIMMVATPVCEHIKNNLMILFK